MGAAQAVALEVRHFPKKPGRNLRGTFSPHPPDMVRALRPVTFMPSWPASFKRQGGQAGRRQKRQRPGALQDAARGSGAAGRAAASWSAVVLHRFSPGPGAGSDRKARLPPPGSRARSDRRPPARRCRAPTGTKAIYKEAALEKKTPGDSTGLVQPIVALRLRARYAPVVLSLPGALRSKLLLGLGGTS